ncbi:MAG TPA: hypothetical protein PLL71_12905 [Agriterribacter sp.]|nr:hypothetical protein [Agriterribacter sp.]HRQ49497.1 hypothetical protein [Agriterribacter sp.]
MKTIRILSFLSILLIAGCKKDNNPEKEQDGGKLTDIVPQDYLNEAKEMGFTVYWGNTPPDISGTYRFAAWRLDADNTYEGFGTAPGYTIANGFAASFTNQTASSIDVSYQGYYEGFENSKPWIMGSGNNFTVCRYIRMDACGGNFRYNYMQLISGTKDGNVLKNVKMTSIGLDALSKDAMCVEEGNIEIWSDVDGISEPE